MLLSIFHSSLQAEKPAAQTAHLVFADTKANTEKPKELFFANDTKYNDCFCTHFMR